eukprot:TRINITY_DN24013_c0_g1_i1.p1 TRINITY_DN24013_c0_g1~~TRINITY_DN24013_c0_g1_i1.p1  ORF type:complete len:322 (-),score=17.85 TRINITY_DN24013_c0_g1_i1:64-930(-)
MIQKRLIYKQLGNAFGLRSRQLKQSPHCQICTKIACLASPTASTDVFEHFSYRCELKDGSEVLIRPISSDMINDVSWLLSQSFGEGGLLYSLLMQHGLKGYIKERISQIPKVIILIAVGNQTKESQTDFRPKLSMSQVDILDEDTPLQNQTETLNGDQMDEQEEWNSLLGTVEIRFDMSIKDSFFETAQPPDNGWYLCNMCVGKMYRGKGIAKQLLQASYKFMDQLLVDNGRRNEQKLYLHVRKKDGIPMKLYKDEGFVFVEDDPWFMSLFSPRRDLMVKDISNSNLQ